jgi:tetratricopeptide (TPR) repeat protein
MTYWHYYSINAQLLVWPYPLCCDWSMGSVPVVSLWSAHLPCVGGLLLCPLVSVASSCALLALVSPLVPSSCLPSCFSGVGVQRRTCNGGEASAVRSHGKVRWGRQDTRNLASLLLMAVLSFWAACVVHGCSARWQRPWSRVVAVAGALTLAPLLPASNLFFPVGFVVAERILYLPSAGPALLVACLLRHVLSSRVLRCAVVMVISLALAARTRARNHEWRTSERLFAAGVAALPNNAKLHYNLGHVTCKGVAQALTPLTPLTQAQNAHTAKAKRALKKWKRCRKLYEEAVRLAPDFQEAHGALGSLVIDSDLQLGLEHLEVALALDPHSKIAQKNIGDALARKQVDIPRAKVHLENAIRLDPTWADAHNNLGNTLLAFNDMAKVREAYENALRFDPAHPNALENMHKFFWSQESKEGLPVLATGAREGGLGGELGASASAPSHGKGAWPKDDGTGEGGKIIQGGKTIHDLPSAPPNDFAHRGWGATPHATPHAPSSKRTPQSSQPTATRTKAPRNEDNVKQAPAAAGTRQHFPAAGSRPHPPRVAGGGEREGNDRHKGRHKEGATQNNKGLPHTNEPSTHMRHEPSTHNARLKEALVQQTSAAQGKAAEADTPLAPWSDTQLPPSSNQRARATHGAEPGQDTRGKKPERLPEAQKMEAKIAAKMEGKRMEAWAESDYRSALEACHRGAGPADGGLPDTRDARDKSCGPAYRRHVLNNLGVLLVQKASSLASASGGVEDGREDGRELLREDARRELLRESIGLFNHALSLKRAWAEAQHNLAQASQALERLRP